MSHSSRNGHNQLRQNRASDKVKAKQSPPMEDATPTDPMHRDDERMTEEFAELGRAKRTAKEESEEEWTDEDEEGGGVGDVVTKNVVVVEETGSLCSQCRAEEAAERAETHKAMELSRQLTEHILEVNEAEIAKHKQRQKEEREREQLEQMEANVRARHFREEEEGRAREQKERTRLEAIENEMRWKDELTKRRERERKDQHRASAEHRWQAIGADRAKGAGEDREKVKTLEEQLKRNEALKQRVERLEQFRRRQKEEDERAKSASVTASRARQEEMTAMLERWRSQSAGAGRHRLQDSSERRRADLHPRVFEAWKEAHEQNEKRYRILQEGIGLTRTEKETLIERKRCRRCLKPIREKKYMRLVQRKNE